MALAKEVFDLPVAFHGTCEFYGGLAARALQRIGALIFGTHFAKASKVKKATEDRPDLRMRSHDKGRMDFADDLGGAVTRRI